MLYYDTQLMSFLSHLHQPFHAYQLHLLARTTVGAADTRGDAGTFQTAVNVEAGNYQFSLL